jgi:hypothetical protein
MCGLQHQVFELAGPESIDLPVGGGLSKWEAVVWPRRLHGLAA